MSVSNVTAAARERSAKGAATGERLVKVEGLYKSFNHMGNVLARLRTPPDQTYARITFPEGFTLQQMAERLAAEQPRLTVEGFLAASNWPRVRSAGVSFLALRPSTRLNGMPSSMRCRSTSGSQGVCSAAAGGAFVVVTRCVYEVRARAATWRAA